MIPRVYDSTWNRELRTIFLDRDGVLNRKAPEGEYVWRAEQVEWLPGVFEALRLLGSAGLRVYVVSNQRGVALRLYTADDVERLHAWMQQAIEREGGSVCGFFYCPHDRAGCACRKPLPGLFEQARTVDPGIEWATSVMIGDSLSDVEAGQRLGMRTIFIEGEMARSKPGGREATGLADAVCDSLLGAVHLLLNSEAD